MLPSRHALRLWELVEHAIEVPQAALAIGSQYQPGSLELTDYLFTTAATLRDAMQTSQDVLHLVTTNGRLEVSADTGRETTYSYKHVVTGTRGSELARQFAICVFYARARAATGRPIVPAHVTFAQPAPRSYREFAAMFGTSRIDFDAPVNSLTFRASDLEAEGWWLEQPEPGVLVWRVPSGRRYVTKPTEYAL